MGYDLGIIVPVYRSTHSVLRLIHGLLRSFSGVSVRICLVDDSHHPQTAEFLKSRCILPEVSLIILDRNYGQQAALLCGLEHLNNCRYYATIDDDLEQSPEVLRSLYDRLRTGYDVVYGIAAPTKRGLIRTLGSRLRDLLFCSLLHLPRRIRVSSLRVMTRDVARHACRQKHGGFFYLSAAMFTGWGNHAPALRVSNLLYKKAPRPEGKSGYHLSSLVCLYGKLLWNYGLFPGNSTRKTKKGVYHIKEIARPPKLMVLGGSNCQLAALKRAEEKHIETVLIDYTDNPPAARWAGVHVKVSTFDTEGCICAAKTYGVDGVMTLGTDQPVYTAACVSQKRRLPSFLSPKEALAVTNKKRMKEILTAASIPTVRYTFLSPGDAEQPHLPLTAPYVLKPLDSQGQRGIFKLDTPREMYRHLPETLRYSRCGDALAEEFYESDELTVSGWIHDGSLKILTVTDRLLYPDSVHIGVCIGHRFPSVHMDRYPEIEQLSQTIVTAFSLRQGPFYLQLLLGNKGFLVNELACRIGGAFEHVFIPYITGFDILDAVIDGALGRPVPVDMLNDYRADRAKERVAVLLLFCRPAVIREITPLKDIQQLSYVLDAGYNYRPEDTLLPVENATARFGHVVICGAKDTINSHIKDFYRRFHVISEAGEEMVLPLFPHK